MPGAGKLVATEVLVLRPMALGEVVEEEVDEMSEGLSWLKDKATVAEFEEDSSM